MTYLSPRQKFRLARQRQILQDAGFYCCGVAVDLGIEDGLSGEMLDHHAIMDPDEGWLIGVDIDAGSCERADPGVYDLVLHMDAIDFLRSCHRKVEVCICAELIEHYEKEKGHELLSLLREKCGAVIVTTPLGFMRQGAIKGNPHQVHLSGWEPKDFGPEWRVETYPEHRLLIATVGL